MIDTSGTIQRQSLYTAWDEDLPGFAATPFPDRYAFTQRENDPESGLMHYRARSYDPRTGRFVQRDPVLDNQPSKHYVYAGNNPASMLDPLGLDEAEWEAAKRFLLDQDWVKSHSRLVMRTWAEDERGRFKKDVFTPGGQAVLDRAYQSYQASIRKGDAISAQLSLRDLEVGYREGPDVLDQIYSNKMKLFQYIFIVQGNALAANLQGLSSAQALNNVLQDAGKSGGQHSKTAKAIAKGEKIAEEVADDADSAFGAQSLGAAQMWTRSGRIKAAMLPHRGMIRYVPPKNWHPSQPLPRGPKGGYIDRMGNEWTKGPGRGGDDWEWDVQLTKQLQEKYDKAHLNVSPRGEVTH